MAAGDPPIVETVADEEGPRIALLSPYSGGNFGDAAIQDSMIENLRRRLPGVQISGISLNNENFVRRHGSRAFALCASNLPFYGMPTDPEPQSLPASSTKAFSLLRTMVRSVPGSRSIKRVLRPPLRILRKEIRHCLAGYSFLRKHDLLIVCGGGQIDDEWGGPWGHPYALFKWTLLARMARVSIVFASVGVCKVNTPLARLLLRVALRRATYRSYRDEKSRDLAVRILRSKASDPVVPDLAFGLPRLSVPQPLDVRSLAQGRTIVAISPIVFSKPGRWPSSDLTLYNRYLDELAASIGKLLESDFFLLFVWSAVSDQGVLPELVARLDERQKSRLERQSHFPTIQRWQDLLSNLSNADFIIASRLHSVIFGFLAEIPVIALSFDSKVDRIMKDLEQTNALLQINSFRASDVIQVLQDLQHRRKDVVQEIIGYRRNALGVIGEQLDALQRIVAASPRLRRQQ